MIANVSQVSKDGDEPGCGSLQHDLLCRTQGRADAQRQAAKKAISKLLQYLRDDMTNF